MLIYVLSCVVCTSCGLLVAVLGLPDGGAKDIVRFSWMGQVV